ncbi:anti-sigma factor antagonist [candidate division KSB1 bacterium]|nr:MAG: anti-sigma factor antagonist [candidate division KSB1 bacterium]
MVKPHILSLYNPPQNPTIYVREPIMMDVAIRREEEVLILALKGKLIGEPYSAKFTEAVKNAIENKVQKIVLDCEGVDWINSTGISMLLSAREKLQLAHVKMRLSAINKSMEGVFIMSKLDKVFEIHPTTDAAIKSFA